METAEHITKAQLIEWLKLTAKAMTKHEDVLTRLDAAIGDADHGINMVRGFSKVMKVLPEFENEDIGSILKKTGMALLSSIGGVSGPLYGTFYLKGALAASGKDSLSLNDLEEVLKRGVEGILLRGRTEFEDKTMYDVWKPVLDTFAGVVHSGGTLEFALDSAVEAAEKGMKATIPLEAKKGRASYLGKRSIGHQDPGATSSYYIVKALRDSVCG